MKNEIMERVVARAIPVRGDDLDTDRIVPARFLRCVTFDGIEEHAFEDDRLAVRRTLPPDVSEEALHPFDQTRFQGARILVVNANFGCGSSREHAPQSLWRWGIQALVGQSFAEIFFGNCVALGVPCVTLASAEISELQQAIEEDPSLEVAVDLRARTVSARRADTGESRFEARAQIPEGARSSFLQGTWDATALLLGEPGEIAAVAAGLPYMERFSR